MDQDSGKKFYDRRQILSLENQAQGKPDIDHDRAHERRFVPEGGVADLEATVKQLGL
jgi:hypothetical protein